MKNLRDSRDFGNPAQATLGHREFTPLHGFGTPRPSDREPKRPFGHSHRYEH